ncbi:FG-GAP-like repeat-containing protein, partial [Streptomyces sp. CO7]
MNRTTRTALATAVAAALTGGLFTAVAPAAVAADAVTTQRADFNGDGVGDVATWANSTVSGHHSAGQVVVTYGTKGTGLTATRRSVISQATPGVPGALESGDRFGWSTAYADFDGDGYDDLAVGSSEDVGDVDNTGTVTLLWGSATGLTGKGAVRLTDPGAPARGRMWGQELAAGDFDGDGRPDLALADGSTTMTLFTGGITRSGAYGSARPVSTPLTESYPWSLTAGDVDGDGATDLLVNGWAPRDGDPFFRVSRNFLLHGSASGLDSAGATETRPGRFSSIGDIDRDGFADIVTGTPDDEWEDGEHMPWAAQGGQIWITYGSEDGPGRIQAVNQDTPGAPGTSEAGDRFGWSTDLGDVDGDGYLDLAVGVMSEDIDDVDNAGSVVLLRGGADGITTTGARTFHQDTSGVPGTAEAYDTFGTDVKLDDVTGDGRADLVVGSGGGKTGNGRTTPLP